MLLYAVIKNNLHQRDYITSFIKKIRNYPNKYFPIQNYDKENSFLDQVSKNQSTLKKKLISIVKDINVIKRSNIEC